jgi:DNA-binding phage protein
LTIGDKANIRANLVRILNNPRQKDLFSAIIKTFTASGKDISVFLQKISGDNPNIDNILKDADIQRELLYLGLGENSPPEVRECAGKYFQQVDTPEANLFSLAKGAVISREAIDRALASDGQTADYHLFETERGKPFTADEMSEYQEALGRAVPQSSNDRKRLEQLQKMNDGVVAFASNRGGDWDKIVARGKEIGQLIIAALDSIAQKENNLLNAERGQVEIKQADPNSSAGENIVETAVKTAEKVIAAAVKQEEQTAGLTARQSEMRDIEKTALRNAIRAGLESVRLPAWLIDALVGQREIALT